MLIKTFQSLFVIALLLTSLLAQAETKPSIVLMPLDISEDDADLEGEFGSAIQSGLQKRYNVYYGRAVEKIIEKEYDKIDCSAERCIQALATEFNTNLIADASVKRVGGGYISKLVIRDIIDERVVVSKAVPCEGCSPFSLLGILEGLGSGKKVAKASNGIGAGTPNVQNAGGVQLVNAEVSGDATSSVAALIFDTVPSGAEVYIGGAKSGVTPYHNFGLRSGQVLDVVIKKADYRDQKLRIPLKGGINQLPDQKLITAYGSLEVTSEPSGADVFLAGQKVGTTPYLADKQDSGNYFLSLRMPMYLPLENQSVEVRDGNKTARHFKLAENFGSLSIKDGTPGTKIDIVGQVPVQPLFPNGEKKTVKFTKSLPLDITLEHGQYQISLSKAGYETKNFKANIVRGEKTDIPVSQAKLRQAVGSVMISTLPFEQGANIYVDNELKGTVPTQLTLPVGSYSIKVETTRMISTQEIKVENRQEQVLTMELKLKGKNQLQIIEYEEEIEDLRSASPSTDNYLRMIKIYESIRQLEPSYPVHIELENIAVQASDLTLKAAEERNLKEARAYARVVAKASPYSDRSALDQAIRNAEKTKSAMRASHAKAIKRAKQLINKPFEKPGWMDLLDGYARIRDELKEAYRNLKHAEKLKPNDRTIGRLMKNLDIKYAHIIDSLIADKNAREARLFIDDATSMNFTTNYTERAKRSFEAM